MSGESFERDIHDADLPPLPSEYADDPEMAELIEFFVSELRERVGALKEAYEAGRGDELRAVVHQLKGAAGGYGYPTISEAARRFERELLAEEAELSAMREQFESLIDLCRRAASDDVDGGETDAGDDSSM